MPPNAFARLVDAKHADRNEPGTTQESTISITGTDET
jgi:hypothetical protein